MFRTVCLIAYAILNVVVFVISFFIGIRVRIRNWILDAIIIPILDFLSPINILLYYIFIWPWEVVFYLNDLIL